MNKEEKAYKEILEALKKHKDLIVFDVDYLEKTAKHHLFGVQLKEKYNFNLDPKTINSTVFQELKENISIGFWDGQKRKIAWPDDGRQPNNEILLAVKYSTGAFMFGQDYPIEFFQKFFAELKAYNPKYIDSTNQSLYFSLDNAGKFFNDYDGILKKYNKENNKDIKQRKIKAMEAKLKTLKAQED